MALTLIWFVFFCYFRRFFSITQLSHVNLGYMQLNWRYLDVLWGPIVHDERKKSSCLSEASFTLLANENYYGSQNIVS